MSEIYDLNIVITALTNTIHDLIDAIEGSKESKDEHNELIVYGKHGELALVDKDYNIISGEHIPIYKNYEATLLGVLMLDNNAFNVVAKIVSACHFATQKHRDIFRAMKSIHDNKKQLDTLMVYEELKKTGKADHDMEKYLFDLAKNALDKVLLHLESIANIVWSNSKQREQDNGKESITNNETQNTQSRTKGY